jgi:hypothetical protein
MTTRQCNQLTGFKLVRQPTQLTETICCNAIGKGSKETSLTVLCFVCYQAKKKNDKLDDLKQELDMDHHKIPLPDLCKRLGSNVDQVSIYFTSRVKI